jgi:tRNA A-37 threonylcarbamoyl transferase component Bud32
MRLDALPPGVSLLGPPGSNHPRRGNLVFRCEDGGEPVILKVYRRRRGLWRQPFAAFSQRFVEGKRGIGAARRRPPEVAALSAWRRHGCDAPRVLGREAPAWIGSHPFLYMEYVAGRSLRDALADPASAASERLALVRALAASCGLRHRRALDADEPLLVQEHPATQHVLVSTNGRLVSFDLENAYAPGFSVPTALAYELASTLRSLSALDDADETLVGAFVGGYGETAILRESCGLFLGPSLRWRLYRRQESGRRGERSKTRAMRRLAARLGLPTGP